MEVKWVAIAIAVWVAVMFGSVAVSEHSKAQCKIAAMTNNMSADDIVKLCK